MNNVVIAESSIALRSGLSHLFATSDRFYVAADFAHQDVLAMHFDWTTVDVLLLGPVDVKNPCDHFSGVEIASAYRRARKMGSGRIVALTEFAKDERLRRRLWEAEVDDLAAISDIESLTYLEDLISGDIESAHLLKPRESEVSLSIGLHSKSRVNHFVTQVQTRGAGYLSSDPPLGAPDPRSRWWGHLRSDLANAGNIRAVNRDGSTPDRRQDTPSIAQLRRVYEWATVV